MLLRPPPLLKSLNFVVPLGFIHSPFGEQRHRESGGGSFKPHFLQFTNSLGEVRGAEDSGPRGQHHGDGGTFDVVIEEKLDAGRYATVSNEGEIALETGEDLLVGIH